VDGNREEMRRVRCSIGLERVGFVS
jgi:hypothetical protein